MKYIVAVSSTGSTQTAGVKVWQTCRAIFEWKCDGMELDSLDSLKRFSCGYCPTIFCVVLASYWIVQEENSW